MRILGIETSCDETSVALLDAGPGLFKLRRHVVSSQAALHRKYGGVVPELAARKQLENIFPILDEHIGRTSLRTCDLIAVTQGPGLVTSLMVGVQVAKTLSYLEGLPLVGVNHLEAHIYANWLTHQELTRYAPRFFPSLVLIISGGHTMLVLMRGHGSYKVLGATLDDAAGEAFDKVAKLLDLEYPGGPAIERVATRGNSSAVKLPRPMQNSRELNFSFSGLKTAVLYYLEGEKKLRRRDIPDIAASFQQAVVDVVRTKVMKACEQYRPSSLMLVGGVSANKKLRELFRELGKTYDIPAFMPALEFTGDNAAMIAATGYFRRKQASKTAWKSLGFDAHLALGRRR